MLITYEPREIYPLPTEWEKLTQILLPRISSEAAGLLEDARFNTNTCSIEQRKAYYAKCDSHGGPPLRTMYESPDYSGDRKEYKLVSSYWDSKDKHKVSYKKGLLKVENQEGHRCVETVTMSFPRITSWKDKIGIRPNSTSINEDDAAAFVEYQFDHSPACPLLMAKEFFRIADPGSTKNSYTDKNV